jgi:hypothetical protein
MTSWQEHTDALVRTGKVTTAGILGHDSVLWAGSSGFALRDNEARMILAAIDSSEYASVLLSKGLYIMGERHALVKSELHESLFAKRAGQGGGGCYARKTGKTIVIVTFSETITPQDCVCEVEKLADYYVSM